MINFGEPMDNEKLENAGDKAMGADLLICMGSSMRVAPASSMPNYTKSMGGKVVMINLQATPRDSTADMVIHERVDKVMEMLM